jgi:phosphotransferase system HPr (HPr) family protein
MNETLRRNVKIANPQGLHMRPAAAFAELAGRFECVVTVSRAELTVDGKNWVELLLLAAEEGMELQLEVTGRDAPRAIDVLAAQLGAAGVAETQTAHPPA